jgi:N-methylhydantoinase B
VKVAPGLDGGLPGGRALLLIEPGTERERLLPTATTALPMTAGLGVRMETPGGGGFGDPAKRDPRALAADILDGKVSRAAAERDHGAALVAAALSNWKERT